MMQKFFSYKYLFLSLLISVLIPFSFAHADPGDTSITIPDPYPTTGTVTVTVEAAGGQTAALTVTLNPPNSTACTVSNSTFSASPDPILVGSGVSAGVTTISANATCAYDIRINSTSGSIFAQEGPGAWSGSTGNWVSNGTVFYLQKRGDSTAEGTLKTETVNLIATPTVTLTPSASSMTLPTNSFTLTWTTTDSPTSCTATGSWSGSKTTTGSSQTITGLTAGTYTYNLTCTNAAGTSSLKTATVVVNPEGAITPNTPTGFSATTDTTCGTGRINTSWNASSGATSYTLKRGSTTIYTGSSLSYSDTGLTAGASYTYTVSASNSAGTSGTAPASANAPSACSVSVPTVTFTASPLSITLPTNSVTLNWSATNAPTGCTASSNPSNTNWNGSKLVNGPQTISNLTTAGPKIFYLYCTNSGGNSITQSQTVNVINAGAPNPDLKGTVWTDANRNVVWGGYNSVDGPVVVFNDARYALSWPAVSNATSCTLDGSNVSVSGGTINTYTATLPSKTHTLSCTGAGGTTSDTFILTMPPAPTNLIGTCPTPYNSASLSWTAPNGYNNFYVRLNEYISPTEDGYTWPPIIATEVIGTTWTPATTPGQSYTWWISTKNVSNGAWSPDAVSYNLVCNVATYPLTVTKAGTGTGTVTPSTGSITWSGNTGTATYNSGTSVTLTAAATGGSTFTGWSGGLCSGTGTCVVSMTQARDVTATFTAPACAAAGTGTGLTGKYYNWTTSANYFQTLVTTRPNDGAINFNPADSIGVSYASGGDTFSVSWEGQIQPRCSENYTFYPRSDDGSRLWINGNLVVNKWVNQASTETASAPIALVAGTKYDIKMEFFENTGGSVAQLSWSSPSTAKAIVPATQLYTVSATTGTLLPATPSCTIASGASSCNVNLSWTTTNPVGTSAITSNYPSSGTTVTTGNTGTNVPLAVPYLSSPRTFYLYNNSVLLAQSTATASCTSGTSWNGSSCAPVSLPVTVSISAGSTNLSYNTATNITWSSTNASSCSVSPTSWAGTSGTQSTGNLTASRTYTVSCNPVGSGSSASVTVNVQAQPKSLTVIKSGQGTITSGPVGISCGSDCTENYAADTTVVLTATPSSGRIFTGWGGDGASCGRSTTCSVNMNGNKSVLANFAVDPNYKEF